MADYGKLHEENTDREFAGLLEAIGQTFTKSEHAEVIRFLDAREYELALETFGGILIEERKPIKPEIIRRIDKIAMMMGL